MRMIRSNPFLPRLGFLLQPSDEKFHSMLAELAALLGWRGTATALGISIRTLDSWRKGKNGPSAGARKLVWLIWSLVFHPENFRSLLDVVTWGVLTEAKEKQMGADVLG